MTRSLAIPTFKSGPQDDLAAPDIYNISSSEAINKVKAFAILDEVKVDKMSMLQGGKAMLEKAKGGLELAKALGNLNVKGGNSFAQLMNGASSLTNAVNAIPKDAGAIGKNFGIYMEGMAGGLKTVANITATIGGVQQQITGLKNMAAGLSQGNLLSKIGAAGNLLNAATGTNFVGGIVSNVQQVAGIASAVKVASENGIKGAFNAVVSGGLGTQALNQVAALCLPSTIKTGDIASLSSMANNLAPGFLKGLNPNILGDVTKAFSLPANAGPTFMSETFNTVKDTFGKITPDWLKAPFGGGQTTDLTCIAGASKDFSLMATTAILNNPNRSEDDELILAGIGEKKKDVHSELESQFPSMVSLKTMNTPSITSNERTYTGHNAREANIEMLVGGVMELDPPPKAAPAVAQPAGQTAVTNEKPWTEADEDAVALISQRYGFDVARYSRMAKSWLMNEWMKGKITDKERDLISRAPAGLLG